MLTIVNVHCDAKKTGCLLMSLAKTVQSNGWPFMSQVFCRIRWAVNSGANGLMLSSVAQII